jgi:hypothetical protein
VVVAADRMVTWGPTEFEHAVPKVTDVTDRIVTLVSGDAMRGSRLVRGVMGGIATSAPAPPWRMSHKSLLLDTPPADGPR